jgi:hypothetical protein
MGRIDGPPQRRYRPYTPISHTTPSALSIWESQMKANICRGETLREVLGTGDTAPPVQRVFEEPAERRQRLMSDLRAPSR